MRLLVSRLEAVEAGQVEDPVVDSNRGELVVRGASLVW